MEQAHTHMGQACAHMEQAYAHMEQAYAHMEQAYAHAEQSQSRLELGAASTAQASAEPDPLLEEGHVFAVPHVLSAPGSGERHLLALKVCAERSVFRLRVEYQVCVLVLVGACSCVDMCVCACVRVCARAHLRGCGSTRGLIQAYTDTSCLLIFFTDTSCLLPMPGRIQKQHIARGHPLCQRAYPDVRTPKHVPPC